MIKNNIFYFQEKLNDQAKADAESRGGRLAVLDTQAKIDSINDILESQGHNIGLLRIRSFPFGRGISSFIDDHEHIIVIEQNRDAQMRSLLINELNKNSSNIHSILNFDGSPVTADYIVKEYLNLLKGNETMLKSSKKNKTAA